MPLLFLQNMISYELDKHKEYTLVSEEKRQNQKFKLHKSLFSRKWFIITAVFSIILIIGTVFGLMYYLNLSKLTSDTTTQQKLEETKTQEARADKINQTVDEAKALANNNKVSDAVIVYDQAIKSAEDDYSKSVLLLSKATMYFNASDYSNALAISLTAEATIDSDVTEYFIAQIYEKKGDNENAIKYYQKAIDLVDSTDPLSKDDIQYYQNKIKELNG